MGLNKDWSTTDEIRFIDTMGIYGKDAAYRDFDGKQYRMMLAKYADATHNRVDWGLIDQAEVLFHVAVLLLKDDDALFSHWESKVKLEMRWMGGTKPNGTPKD